MDCKEVVRIKVKMCDGLVQPVYKKLCIDPQITSFETLRHLLAKAFDTNAHFTISYLCTSGPEKDVYVSMLTDWDYDAALLDSSSPVLRLKVDLKPFDGQVLRDYDRSTPPSDSTRLSSMLPVGLLGNITKTVSTVGKAIGLKTQEDTATTGVDNRSSSSSGSQPLCDASFREFLDPVGHLVRPLEFRLAVYTSGVEPALRKVVWRHLLHIYPPGLSGKQRYEYMQQKCTEYARLKQLWKTNDGSVWSREDVARVCGNVKKDVLRTDRVYPYFAGTEDNENLAALYSVLVTYALTHPSVSYCQGMSDLASPLLVVEKQEGGTYVCFVALMHRLREQFSIDGLLISTKLRHLALLLDRHDPLYYAYLASNAADDLLFTYRWLLLETKREFPLDDALYVLEVMWSTVPYDCRWHVGGGLKLCDDNYSTVQQYVKNPIAAYLSIRAHRRRTSSNDVSLAGANMSVGGGTPRPGEEMGECCELEDVLKWGDEGSRLSEAKGESVDRGEVTEKEVSTDRNNSLVLSADRSESAAESKSSRDVRLASMDSADDSTEHTMLLEGVGGGGGRSPLLSMTGVDFVKVARPAKLPPPEEFGAGNPFLVFLCLVLLLEQREHVMEEKLDYNELAIHYDKQSRRYDYAHIVQKSRMLYSAYLKEHKHANQSGADV